MSDPRETSRAGTSWSTVLRAAAEGSAAESFTRLCRLYAYPVYVFLRRSGHSPAGAAALTVSFCDDIARPGQLDSIDGTTLRFREWVMSALRRFLVETRQSAPPAKSAWFDARTAEDDYCSDLAQPRNGQSSYDRAWSLALLRSALERLVRECDEHGKYCATLLEPWLVDELPAAQRDRLASLLGLTPASLRVQLFRLRARLRTIIRGEICDLVEGGRDSDAVRSEIEFLIDALRAR
jgi:RNA polymerase sigma-70 factor (ECF subfamily)